MLKRAMAFCLVLMAGSVWGETSRVDMTSLQQLLGRVQSTVGAGEWDTAAQLVKGYSVADDFNAHVGGAIAKMLVPHDELLSAAEGLVARCIATNSLGNLAMLGEMNATELKLRMDYAGFYSVQALIYLKTERIGLADSAMAMAFSYMTSGVEPQAADLLRAGLIAYRQGHPDEAWQQVLRGLLLDSSVERGDPVYLRGITALVSEREGRAVEIGPYLAEVRRRRAKAAPDLQLKSADGVRSSLRDRRGKAALVWFFTPICGSCQQLIPRLKPLYEARANEAGLEFLFILNNPSLIEECRRFLDRIGFSSAPVVTMTEGSPFDFIPGEPTVWILDSASRVVARHTGYNTGDELTCDEELKAAATADRAGGE